MRGPQSPVVVVGGGRVDVVVVVDAPAQYNDYSWNPITVILTCSTLSIS